MNTPTDRDAIQNFEETVNSLPITDDSRTEARLCAVQAISQWQLLGLDEGIADEFLLGAIKTRKAQKKLFLTLFHDVKTDKDRYTTLINSCLQENWGMDRMASTLQAVLYVATSELSTMADTPTGTIITEYLTLTRAFTEEADVAFTHGILTTLAKKIRPE